MDLNKEVVKKYLQFNQYRGIDLVDANGKVIEQNIRKRDYAFIGKSNFVEHVKKIK